MRFYQVHFYETSDGSHGYRYFTSYKKADHAAKQWLKENNDESSSTTITAVNFQLTKAGILAALNRYASHPDNG